MASLRVRAPTDQPLDITGPLRLSNAAFDTPDATIAGERLGALCVGYRKTPMQTRVRVDGPLLGGEFLVGNAYVALPDRPVGLLLDGVLDKGGGWRFPVIQWRDGEALTAAGVPACCRNQPAGAGHAPAQFGSVAGGPRFCPAGSPSPAWPT